MVGAVSTPSPLVLAFGNDDNNNNGDAGDDSDDLDELVSLFYCPE